MSFYDNMATTALKLLTSKGQTVTFSREVSSGFDPALGIDTTSTTTFTGKAAHLNYKNSEIDGTQVIKGDSRLILEATATVPLVSDTVTVDSIVWRVMDVEPVSPAGTVVIYKIQVRK